MTHSLLPPVLDYCQQLDYGSIDGHRANVLKPLIKFVRDGLQRRDEVVLNFICTHNSRRSQFSQIWAMTAASFFGKSVVCYSGGVEVTEFNYRAVASLEKAGFNITKRGTENPDYLVRFDEKSEPIKMFSKLYDSTESTVQYAAVMTCSHADQNCPVIPEAKARIPVLYEDPKKFDGTNTEEAAYAERCRQIAQEMFYMFSKV